jgi:hypothetical protein
MGLENFCSAFLAALKALVSPYSSYSKSWPLQFAIRITIVHLTQRIQLVKIFIFIIYEGI